ncbi:MAG: hypothetical protein AB7S38_00950 [Vulcanimicrobiota bacterium]
MTDPTHRFRALAVTFPCFRRFIAQGRLPERAEPRDLTDLGGLSPTENTIVPFLLHVSNRYDNPFELDDLIGAFTHPRHVT